MENKTQLSVSTEVLEKLTERAALEIEGVKGIAKKAVDIRGAVKARSVVKAVKIGTFLRAKFNNEETFSIMQKTLVFEDNNICIFKPTNFQESSVIGEPICCFAYSQGRWDEHYNGYQEAIYYVYDVMKEGTQHDFVSITVRPNGRAVHPGTRDTARP